MAHLHQKKYPDHFSRRSWHRQIKQQFIEFFHDRRDNLSEARTTVKNYSCTAVQKIVDKPVPYLFIAIALGFFLASMFRNK